MYITAIPVSSLLLCLLWGLSRLTLVQPTTNCANFPSLSPSFCLPGRSSPDSVMRLGGSGIPYDGDPLTMSAAGNDYAELCDLGPSRWSTRAYGYHATAAANAAGIGIGGIGVGGATQSSSSVPTGGSAGLSAHHLRSSAAAPNSYEAEDIGLAFGMISPPPGSGHGHGHYGGSAGGIGSRVGNSTSSLRASGGGGGGGGGGRSGLYYSPPGTSYTIIERPHSPHYYYNSAGVPTKGGSLPGRGSAYLSSSPSSHMAAGTAGTLPTSTAASGRHGSSAMGNGNKKRPISPEQVLRMFGATQSSSVPTSSYHYSNGGTRDRDRTGRRSPASSPPSTTHQVSLPKMQCAGQQLNPSPLPFADLSRSGKRSGSECAQHTRTYDANGVDVA